MQQGDSITFSWHFVGIGEEKCYHDDVELPECGSPMKVGLRQTPCFQSRAHTPWVICLFYHDILTSGQVPGVASCATQSVVLLTMAGPSSQAKCGLFVPTDLPCLLLGCAFDCAGDRQRRQQR